jgi:D-alanyl-D-alanine carboxypeptidase (penicillin-binding protein 5/6)
MRPPAILAAAVVGTLILTPALAGPAQGSTGEPIGGPLLGTHQTVVDYSGGASKLPKVLAASWVIADADTGEVLAAKAPHQRHRPASTLKTLTAVTLLPLLSKSATYIPTDDDVNVEGSRAGLVPLAPYTIDQIFYAMFLPSGNDAATSLAHAAGSVKGTIALMNAKARSLQALDTSVKNPTGLDADGQYSSAYDLALIARAGVARPDFRRYIGTLQHSLPGKLPKKGHHRGTFQLWNQDRLLQQGYSGLIGGKTGWTTLAGRTFIAAAQRGGHTLVVTLMGIKEPSADAARALFAWGFHNVNKARPVGVLVGPATAAQSSSPSPSASSSAAPTTSASPSLAAAVSPSNTSGSSRPSWLVWAGAALVLIGMVIAVRPLLARRRRGTERDRLLAAARRWSS